MASVSSVEGGDETTEIRVVVNWFEELERIAPSRK